MGKLETKIENRNNLPLLHEYIQKGFVINDDRFKNGNKFDESYFKEILERIREIRLSERRIYLKIYYSRQKLYR